jgi:DsbC/DsbD-like thiol-disulfide interchange protein
MLSDKGSAVIRKFGILNANMPEGHPFCGIPFPGDYLIGANGVVRDKQFLPDYQTRPSSSQILMRNFAGSAGGAAVAIDAQDLRAVVTMSADRAVAGEQLGVSAELVIGPGWHIYGQPLPDNYVATSISFDRDLVTAESFEFPKATPVEFKSLGETLPVYSGSIRTPGIVQLKMGLKPGEYKLKGTLQFQQCNDEVCKLPEKIAFEIPVKIEPMVAGAK